MINIPLGFAERDGELQPRDEVATIGHPFGIKLFSTSGLDSNLNFVMSRGIISKINPENIIVDLSLSSRNSGESVFKRISHLRNRSIFRNKSKTGKDF
jgi:hypothetical protein